MATVAKGGGKSPPRNPPRKDEVADPTPRPSLKEDEEEEDDEVGVLPQSSGRKVVLSAKKRAVGGYGTPLKPVRLSFREAFKLQARGTPQKKDVGFLEEEEEEAGPQKVSASKEVGNGRAASNSRGGRRGRRGKN